MVGDRMTDGNQTLLSLNPPQGLLATTKACIYTTAAARAAVMPLAHTTPTPPSMNLWSCWPYHIP
jgi:hypothetical protein